MAFDHFVFEIEVARESGFDLWKVILPLFIIVAISWSVFWMTDEPLAGRSRITATGVLTIVAYQFVVAGDLPRIAYLTLLDKVMIVSLVLLAVTIVQSMIVARYQRDDPVGATRIDRASRWLFPSSMPACSWRWRSRRAGSYDSDPQIQKRWRSSICRAA